MGASSAGSSGGDAPAPSAEPALGNPGCPVCHGLGWVGADVPVDDPRFGRAVACSCRAEDMERQRHQRLQRYSNLGALAGAVFDDTLAEGVRAEPRSREMFAQALQGARRYAEDPQGWLVLAGPSGCGKTHLAAAIANARLAQGQPALFVFVPDFLDHLRAAYAPDAELGYDALFHQVREAPLLVLDDLGAQSATPWAQEKLFQVLNHRFAARLPTVITLGVPLEDVEPRLHSRLTDLELSKVYALAVAGAGRAASGDALGLPRFQEMTFASFQTRRPELSGEQRESLEAVHRVAQAYAERPEGWLVLMGDHGVGKTHLAAAVAHACRGRGMGVLFLVVPDLLDHLRYTFRPDSDVTYDEVFEGVKQVPLLVLDDLGAHATSPWAQEKLYQIINYRYNARLPMVVTTDLSLDEMERAQPRIASRLADTRFSVPFLIDAPDYRVDRVPTQGGGPRTGGAPPASARRPAPGSGDGGMDRRRLGR